MAHVLSHLTEEDKKFLLQNSVERVINTTIDLLGQMPEDRRGLRSTNEQDWFDIKPVVVKIFNNARDEVFVEATKKTQQDKEAWANEDKYFVEKDGMWYHADETWSNLEGPYFTREIARLSLIEYAKKLLLPSDH